uniref:receptor protein-tyrosine kinase n=1 Tax=Acrobeloides nanus TaxID=290746 RepID=A0A914DV44_9BILA
MALYVIILICFIVIIATFKSEECDNQKCQSCPNGSDKCQMCMPNSYFKYRDNIYMDCFDRCPKRTYPKLQTEGMKECISCHPACKSKCSGPNSILGDGGCDDCVIANFTETSGQQKIYRCLNHTNNASENLCTDNNLIGYYPEPILNQTKTEFECKKCDPLCASCISGGTSVEKDKCRCAKGAVEKLIDNIMRCVKHEEIFFMEEQKTGLLRILNNWGTTPIFLAILSIGILLILVVVVVLFLLKKKLRRDSWTSQDHELVPLTEIPEQVSIEDNRFNLIPGNELKRDEKSLSSGHFGVVYRGTWLGRPVAIKVLKNQESSESVRNALNYEISIMHHVRGKHQHLHCLVGICLANNEIELVSELRMGSLKDYLRIKIKELTTRDLVRFCCQIADAMSYLESKEIIHGDLAVRNVLVKNKEHVEVSDFGLARYLRGRQGASYRGDAPLWWMSVECLENLIKTRVVDFTLQNDVWAFGVTCWEVFTFAHYNIPYHAQKIYTPEELLRFLKNGKRLEHVETCPSECYQLLLNSWMEKDQRMSFSHLHRSFETILASMPTVSVKAQQSTSNTAITPQDSLQILHQLAKIRPDFSFPYGACGLYPLLEAKLRKERSRYEKIDELLTSLMEFEIFLDHVKRNARNLSSEEEKLDSIKSCYKAVKDLQLEVLMESVGFQEFEELLINYKTMIEWQEKVKKIAEFIEDDLSSFVWKISYLQLFHSRNVQFIQNLQGLNNAQLEPTLFVIFVCWTDDWQLLSDNIDLFTAFLNTERQTLGFVDLCINEEFARYSSKTTIKFYINGQCIDDDVLSSVVWKNLTHIPQQTEPLTVIPKNEVNFTARCPKSTSGCISWKREWKCGTCDSLIKVGFNDMLYCICGQASGDGFQFRCGDPNHGLEYMQFEEDEMRRLLIEQAPKKEISIFIFGENTEWNESFAKALKNFIKPSKFECEDHGFIKIYKFFKSFRDFSIVVFPGLERIKDYWENGFLEILQKFPTINSMCVVLEPTLSELSLKFLHSLENFLGLGKDSTANLVVFEHCYSRETLVGTITNSLDYEQPHAKYFCLEMEAVNCLLNNEVGFEDQWPRTAQEMQKFFNYTLSTHPYKTSSAVERLTKIQKTFELTHAILKIGPKTELNISEVYAELEQVVELLVHMVYDNQHLLPSYDLFEDILYCYMQNEKKTFDGDTQALCFYKLLLRLYRQQRIKPTPQYYTIPHNYESELMKLYLLPNLGVKMKAIITNIKAKSTLQYLLAFYKMNGAVEKFKMKETAQVLTHLDILTYVITKGSGILTEDEVQTLEGAKQQVEEAYFSCVTNKTVKNGQILTQGCNFSADLEISKLAYKHFYVSNAKSEGIKTIRNHEDLQLEIQAKQKAYLLYFPDKIDSLFYKNFMLLCQLSEEQENTSSCFIYDSDHQTVKIEFYENGNYAVENVLEILKKPGTINHVEPAALVDEISPFENLLSLPCPGENCIKFKRKWTCSTCNKPLYFANNNNVYCNCGQNALNNIQFKCCYWLHKYFLPFQANPIEEQPLKPIKFLVLKENDLPLSHFINSMLNYTKFETFEEAKKSKVVSTKSTFNNSYITQIHRFSIKSREFHFIDSLQYTDNEETIEYAHVNSLGPIDGLFILLQINAPDSHRNLKQKLSTIIDICSNKNLVFFFAHDSYIPKIIQQQAEPLLEGISFDQQTAFSFFTEAYNELCEWHSGANLNSNLKLLSECWSNSRKAILRLLEACSQPPVKRISHASLLVLQKTLKLTENINDINLDILNRTNNNIHVQFNYWPMSSACKIVCLSEKCLRKYEQSEKIKISQCKDNGLVDVFEAGDETWAILQPKNKRIVKNLCKACNCLAKQHALTMLEELGVVEENASQLMEILLSEKVQLSRTQTKIESIIQRKLASISEIETIKEELFSMPRVGKDLYKLYIEQIRKTLKENLKNIEVINYIDSN